MGHNGNLYYYIISTKFISGLDKIEFLQNHDNQDIYQKAFNIIEKYFGTEEEDKDIAPQADEEQFRFGNVGDNPEAFQL